MANPSIEIYEVDGTKKGTSIDVSWQVVSIYWVCHVSISDWALYRIEASLRLPCISHIYKAHHSFISTIFNQESFVRANSSTLSEHSVEDLYPQNTPTINFPPRVVSTCFNIMVKLHFRPCIFVRLITPVNTFKPVSLKFYRRFVGNV